MFLQNNRYLQLQMSRYELVFIYIQVKSSGFHSRLVNTWSQWESY